LAKKDEITSTEKLLELIRKKGARTDESEAPAPVKKKLFSRKVKPTARRRSKKIIKVGIDINDTDLTMAVVNQVPENRHKLLEIRRVALEAKMKKGSPEFTQLLKGSLRELAGKYKDPALWATISSADVETRFLQIPKVPARQTANAVRWAYQKEAAITDTQIFDFHVVESTYADGEQKKNIIAYTAPKNEINNTRELFTKAGWPLKGISIVPFAIQNLLKAGWIRSSGKNVCTVFIGRDWSRIAIFSKNILILSRDIKAGARSMVQAILETLDKKSPPAEENMSVALPDEALPLERAEANRNQMKAEKLFAEFLESRPAADGPPPGSKKRKTGIRDGQASPGPGDPAGGDDPRTFRAELRQKPHRQCLHLRGIEHQEKRGILYRQAVGDAGRADGPLWQSTRIAGHRPLRADGPGRRSFRAGGRHGPLGQRHHTQLHIYLHT